MKSKCYFYQMLHNIIAISTSVVMTAGVFFCTPAYAATDVGSFPASYQPYIQTIANAHPNWTLKPYHTGVSWNEVMNYETEINVNLIENSVPGYWLSKEQNVTYNGKKINLYNYSTGQYYILSAPNWVQPKDNVIAYYLDPRNFLNENDIFMFENLKFNAASHTVDNINVVLRGTWMYQKALEDNPFLTYAQAFLNIGKENDISPLLLASRIVQEQGANGSSPLISGKETGYEGYYNYFNINAYGQSYTEIYKNGLEEAKNSGWNTRYNALSGGAKKISERYVSRGQTTLYFQKFDVVQGVSWHQYMQNVRAPYHEGQRVRASYVSGGFLDSKFEFLIPVYTNMPGAPCQITKPWILGDIDESERVDAADALLVLKHSVRLQELNASQLQLADVDKNGDVNAEDALLILKYAVRLIPSF